MGHRLKGLIEKKKSDIIKNWFESTIQTYTPDTALFYKGQKDQFGNPVGSITSKGIAFLMDQLLDSFDPDAIKAYLDPIIRIRAIQDFTPSQATGFILLLKKVLRENLASDLQNAATATQLLKFESKIDQLCLLAFDLYMDCKEKLYEISANETRNRTFRAFERAGLIVDISQKPKKMKDTNR
ncbi:MAG: RsbRD N-terminal domain-containing protein [Desulfobacterales bacterium]|jgi:hypothetical protein